MKTLSLLQPWATLVAIGAKAIDTRSWATRYRGPLLIHASARLTKESRELCTQEPFRSVLDKWNQSLGNQMAYDSRTALPLGRILCRANLVNCRHTIDPSGKGLSAQWVRELSAQERAFGDYSPGRFGWFLENIQPLCEPIQAKGALYLWDFPDAKLPKEIA